ncbi:hypothetical protein CPB84DRAFT_1850033 [Gymnopilus junonius]|uniref:Uncharacterized protein n=1 Tax=Gymnopilus junonius TaxID=109634 RepID=A0A9P5NJA6_GYMJU|nr:hypothetical protein CPB84DRAFT_1850033 [Gymnopilus junonius]
MSSPPKGKSATDPPPATTAAAARVDDAEVAAILEHSPQLGADPAAWLADKHGDLDWSYTSRTLRGMSDAHLLRLLTQRAVVSIPQREYNPSAPFVHVKTSYGTVALPHGYRTPLSFVVKYIWESVLEALKDERRWKKDRVAIFHLWRVCESLLRRAEVKAGWMGGMEKVWRCPIFDRLLTRFYKHSARCDPLAVEEFLEDYGEREYDRDVQKHDWKRWCMRGLNGVQMTEEEVCNGITDTEFKRSVRPADDDGSRWYLDGTLIPFINDEEDPAYTSTSDLTDFDMDDDLSDVDTGGVGGGKNATNRRGDDSDGFTSSDEDESSSASTQHPNTTATITTTTSNPASASANGVGAKRSRPNGVGADDNANRSING